MKAKCLPCLTKRIQLHVTQNDLLSVGCDTVCLIVPNRRHIVFSAKSENKHFVSSFSHQMNFRCFCLSLIELLFRPLSHYKTCRCQFRTDSIVIVTVVSFRSHSQRKRKISFFSHFLYLFDLNTLSEKHTYCSRIILFLNSF